MHCVFGVTSANSSPSLGPPSFLLCYFLKVLQFYILFLNLWFILRFFGKLFEAWVEVSIFFLLTDVQLLQCYLLKSLCSSTELLLHLGQKSPPLLASVDITLAGRKRDISLLLPTRPPPVLLGWPCCHCTAVKVLTPLQASSDTMDVRMGLGHLLTACMGESLDSLVGLCWWGQGWHIPVIIV